MSVHLQREIERLKKHLLSICTLVEEQVEMAVRSLTTRDPELASQVECRDAEIDQREVEVEEDCLKVLALYQPVAVDLRLIVSALKINNDLERIGDLAVNIARKEIAISHAPAGRDSLRPRRHVGKDPGDAPRQHRCVGEHGRAIGQRRVSRAMTRWTD